jgi:hypothetical protein
MSRTYIAVDLERWVETTLHSLRGLRGSPEARFLPELLKMLGRLFMEEDHAGLADELAFRQAKALVPNICNLLNALEYGPKEWPDATPATARREGESNG